MSKNIFYNALSSAINRANAISLADECRQESIRNSFFLCYEDISLAKALGYTKASCSVDSTIVKEVASLLKENGFKVKMFWFFWGVHNLKISWA